MSAGENPSASPLCGEPAAVDSVQSCIMELSGKIMGQPTSSQSDVHRVRNELSSQVQTVITKQESQIRQLEAQISQIQQEMRPRIQNAERQQEFSKKQLEDVREKIQKLVSEDLSPLQHQFDQLSSHFDRFMHVEVDAKLKPLKDDVRHSKGKLDDISASSSSSFRKISDSIKEISDKLGQTAESVRASSASFSSSLNEIGPGLSSLGQQAKLLSDVLSNSSQFSTGGGDFGKQIKDAEAAMVEIQTSILPEKVKETSTDFIDALNKLDGFCRQQIADIQAKLAEINKQYEAEAGQSLQSEQILDSLSKKSFDRTTKVKLLDQDVRSKLSVLEMNIKSSINQLSSQLADLSAESEMHQSQMQDQIGDELASMKTQIKNSIRAVKDELKTKAPTNLHSQEASLSKVGSIKDSLDGKGNYIGRLAAVEDQIKYCNEAIAEEKRRMATAAAAKCGTLSLAARLDDAEDRLKAAEERLQKIDGLKAANTGHSVEISVEDIPPKPLLKGEVLNVAPPPTPMPILDDDQSDFLKIVKKTLGLDQKKPSEAEGQKDGNSTVTEKSTDLPPLNPTNPNEDDDNEEEKEEEDANKEDDNSDGAEDQNEEEETKGNAQ